MGTFSASDGTRFTKQQIDRKIRNAKIEFSGDHIAQCGEHFCCAKGENVSEKIDVSHIVSVRECQNAGRCEQAWNPANMEMESRTEHMKWERNFNSKNAIADIQKQKNFERKLRYIRENWHDKYLLILDKLK